MDGRFSVDDDDIMGLLELVQANTRWESGRPLERSGLLKQIGGAVIGKLDRVNQRARSKANVAHHYDLSDRSEEHTSELQSLIRISYAVFCLKKKKTTD